MMPNIQPTLPVANNSGPSTAPFSTSSQNLQTKSFDNNGQKDKKYKPSNQETNQSYQTNVNETPVNTMMADLQVNCNSEGVNGYDNSTTPIKNTKRKDRQRLHLATGMNGVPDTTRSAHIHIAQGPNNSANHFFANHCGTQLETGANGVPETNPSAHIPIDQGSNGSANHFFANHSDTNLITAMNDVPETSQSAHIPISEGPNGPIHNFFASHSGAGNVSTSPSSYDSVYVSNSSRYLNNLLHHPQFQHMQNVQNAIDIQHAFNSIALSNNKHATSAPNTPLMHSFTKQGSASIPCSPIVATQSNAQYFQNMMQHPLLSHNFNMDNSVQQPQAKIVKVQQMQGNNALLSHNFNVNNSAKQKTPAKSGKVQQPQAKNSPRCKNNNKISENETNPEEKRFEKYLTAEEVDEGLKNGSLFEGVLRINPKQFQHGFISTSDREEQDMFIDGIKNRNRALEGDVVVVQLIETITNDTDVEEDPEKKQKRGKVVFIKEKVHSRSVIGNLKLMPDKNRQRALFIPRDYRVPRLNIPFSCWPTNFYQDAKKYEDTLFLAKIVDWFDTRFALGKILTNIGQAGELAVETKAILAQNDLDVTPFGSEVRDLFPGFDYTIPDEEIHLREDCRNQCIFSIDPFSCRDIDDAMSCIQLPNGNYEVGVHISDVAHYLKENTVLDEKVAQKATTIYLVECAYHMLPDGLCILSSLFPGVDKLAFSVFWEITKDAEVLHHRFAKTIINSCAQLAYEHAQAILMGRDEAGSEFPELYNGFEFKEIQNSIKVLGDLSAKLRKKRFDGGALRIDKPQVAFRLCPKTGLPESFSIYDIKESNQLIEEFMLLANMTVARRIYEDHPTLAFLRSHPPPSGHMMRTLAKSLLPLGIDLDFSSAGDLHRSLLVYTGPDCPDKGKAMVLNMLCSKPMSRARYLCATGCEDEDFHHYALNVPLYTHFTSPIRRYADIMVHRLLAASLGYRKIPKWNVDDVRKVAAQCNKQKYNAKRAGEMSSELYMLKYIEAHSPVLTEAVVVEVKEKHIDVIIAAMGLNRRVFFNNNFPGEFNCVKHEGGNKMSKMEVVWRAEEGKPEVKQIIEAFTIVKVLMIKGKDDAMVKVETKLTRPDN